MKWSVLIVFVAFIIIVGGVVYFSKEQAPSAPVLENQPGAGTGVVVSPYDFNKSGCVGDEGDMQVLKQMCPSSGGCNVAGEIDPIQVAFKFAEAQNAYPCK